MKFSHLHNFKKFKKRELCFSFSIIVFEKDTLNIKNTARDRNKPFLQVRVYFD